MSQQPERKKPATRELVFSVLQKVLQQGRSLSDLRDEFQKLDDTRDRALAMEITNGVLRWRWKLEALLALHLKKPLKQKDLDLKIIMETVAVMIRGKGAH